MSRTARRPSLPASSPSTGGGRRLGLALLLLLLPLLSCAGPGRDALLAYVAVAGNNHIQVVDLATGKTLRKIYSGATPWRLIPAPDGKALWVQHWSPGTTARRPPGARRPEHPLFGLPLPYP